MPTRSDVRDVPDSLHVNPQAGAGSRGHTGSLPALLGVTDFFLMRAFKTTAPTRHVYWFVVGSPDLTGSSSGVPPGDLTDIVVLETP